MADFKNPHSWIQKHQPCTITLLFILRDSCKVPTIEEKARTRAEATS